jgi:drug/metabolite transporter (DMT)-like permease
MTSYNSFFGSASPDWANMTHLSQRPSPFAIAVAFAVLYISWGTTYLPTRLAVFNENMPPLLFGGIRIFCAGLVLLLYQVVRGAGIGLTRADLWKILTASGLLFLIGAGLMNMASESVTSGVCAALAATTPLWLGLFAMLSPKGERLTPRGWLGLLVGLAGVLLLVWPQVSKRDDSIRFIGVAYALGSAVSWAIGSLAVRHLPLRTSHLTAAGYQLAIGGFGMTLLGVVLNETERWPDQLTSVTISAFFYLLLIGSLAGFVAFNWLLGHVAAAKVGTYAYVNPVIAIFVGWGAGEPLTLGLLAGICVILVGVFLVRGGERPARAVIVENADPIADFV